MFHKSQREAFERGYSLLIGSVIILALEEVDSSASNFVATLLLDPFRPLIVFLFNLIWVLYGIENLLGDIDDASTTVLGA